MPNLTRQLRGHNRLRKPGPSTRIDFAHPLRPYDLQTCWHFTEGGFSTSQWFFNLTNDLSKNKFDIQIPVAGQSSYAFVPTRTNGIGLKHSSAELSTNRPIFVQGNSSGVSLPLTGLTWSVEILFCPIGQSAGSYGAVLTKDGGNGVFLRKNSAGLDLYYSGDNQIGATVFQDSTWYHAIISVANKVATLYLNGVQDGTSVTISAMTSVQWNCTLCDTNAESLLGIVDYLRWWNRALTASEAVMLYESPCDFMQQSAPKRHFFGPTAGVAATNHFLPLLGVGI